MAVLPVPLIIRAWEAFDHPLFVPAMQAVMRQHDAPDPTVAVLMGSRADVEGLRRVWGGVMLQGRREQVERGREQFVGLMEQNYYRRADPRILHNMQGEAMTRLWQASVRNGENSQPPLPHEAPPTSGASAGSSSTSPSSSRQQPPPPPPPCVQLLARGKCARPADCQLSHDPYPVVVARMADTSPTSQPARELSSPTPRFSPQLAPLTSSSPLAYVVSLPFPCIPTYSAIIMGGKRQHATFITHYCQLHYCMFTQTLITKTEQERLARQGEAGHSWLPVNGEGSAHCVDRLLECIFWLQDRVQINRWLDTTETVVQLRRHMSEWERRRERAELGDGEFFAFQSRGIPFRVPPIPAGSNSSPAAASARPPVSPLSPASPTSADTDDTSSSSSTDMSPAPLTSLPADTAPPLALSPVAGPAASLLLPSEADSAEVTVAARLAYQLADMHAAGLRVAHTAMDAFYDDHCLATSPQSIPYIRLLSTAQFACLPLPLTPLSRKLLICAPFDALPIPADIEAETGVDLYVPPLPIEVGVDGGAVGVLCNVQFSVLVVSEQSSQQLEDAVLRVMMRWEAVKQYMGKQGVFEHADTNGVH